MGRPAKSLAQLVRDGTFRARRPAHRVLLAGPELPWPAFAELQRKYSAASSEAEQRVIALAFEHAVAAAQREAARQEGRSLQAQLTALGPAGSVEQLINFFPAFLVHTKGPLRGQPFELEAWQKAFLRTFYRRDKQGRRVYRWALLALPRGNGKTFLAAGIALYELVTRSDAPDIFFAAGSKEQAGIAFAFARDCVAEGPLAEYVTAKQGTLYCPATKGTMKVLSSEGALLHGLAPAVVILDELHAFEASRQEEAYAALTTALHKREDAYLLAITTAGYDKSSLLGRIYERALEWTDGETRRQGCLTIAADLAHGQLMWWFGAPAAADLEDHAVWRRCNPASFVKLRDLERQRHDPGLGELGFRRLHLNHWTAARDAWLAAGIWEKLADDAEIAGGSPVYVGVDVGLYQDTTAVCWAHRHTDGRIILRAQVWAANPKAAAHNHVEGKVELEHVEQFILGLAQRYRVREVAYDPRFFHRSAELLEKKGLTLVEFLPASGPLADASQRFYQLAIEQKLAHDGDPVLAAHLAATAAKAGERGWHISKRKSRLVIDATIAAIMAVARADLNATTTGPQIYWMEWDG